MPSARPILIVEDDMTVRETLLDQLGLDGEFAPEGAVSAADADRLLEREGTRFDAILLDIGLPDADGREYCAKLRESGIAVPIIMLTGQGAEQDVVRGLDSGANDYIPKPFRLNELLARLRAQMRVFDSSEHAVFTIGPYEFRPAMKQLIEVDRGRKIRLTEKEAAILKFLYRAGGAPVPRQTLLNEVWGYNAAVTTHTLETHVYRLRQKIEPDPADTRLLVTEPGGYRLAALGR